ncbi:MAG: DsbA family oxidoreductase [Gaiellales bacterium]|nr:DsbA family oxidoreductase [Gaiellales bacterium]
MYDPPREDGALAIEVRVFSDYICPFCYIGKGLLDMLAESYDLTVTWLGYELHPETPTQGLPMAEHFPGQDTTKMYDAIIARGAELGLHIKPAELLSNSRLALEAAEYARDAGVFDAFHAEVFRLYFGQGLDLGRFRVLRQAAESCGLDIAVLRSGLENKLYANRLSAAREQAQRHELTGLPTFIVNNRYKIVGAQPLQTFQDLFDKLSGNGAEEGD